MKEFWPVCVVVFLLGCLDKEPYERPVSSERVADASIAEIDSSSEAPDEDDQRTYCARTFVYRHAGERMLSGVRLAGDFEAAPWSGAVEMDGPNQAGEFVTELRLPEGRYQYKFVVEGQWIVDPENPNLVDDGQGNQNTVFEHNCPFEPQCILNADCEGSNVCRNFECKTCECPNDWVCAPDTKQCLENIPCTENSDCVTGEVCRAGQCGACIDDGECSAEQVCLIGGCGDALCRDDVECNVESQRCQRYECAEKPCASQNFFLSDPNSEFVSVRLAGDFTDWIDNAVDMQRLDNGRWWTSIQLQNGSYQYKFVLTKRDNSNVEWIADPQNNDRVPDGVNGENSRLVVNCEGGTSALCGDPDVFDWRDAVMYFAMVDRFFDSDGQRTPVEGATDGDAASGPSGQFEGGDLRGLTQKLDYLTELGVTALWLSAPYDNRDFRGDAINRCQGDNNPNGCDPNFYSSYHGYWPSPQNVDYSDPDNPVPAPIVESRLGTDMDLMELVDSAHASGMKVLFDYVMNHIDVASPLYDAHPDWFATREDGSFFKCADSDNGQIGWNHPYWGTRCVFTDYLPAFDFDNAAARAWSIADALWWAKAYGIDGYRLDAIKHVSQEWLTELRTELNTAFPEPDGGRFYLVGETFDYFDKDLLKSFIDTETKLDGQFDFPLKKRLCEGVFHSNMNGLRDFMDGENRGFYGPGSLMTTWIGNHDIPRAIHYASGEIQNCTEGSNKQNGWDWRPGQPQDAAAYERLGLAFGVLFTTEGIPLIYYGDEVGLAGGGDPDNRRMMPWNDADLLDAQKDLRAHLRRLGQIRSQYKTLSRGDRQTLSADGDTWVYQSTCRDALFEDLIVAINRGDAPRDNLGIPAGRYLDLLTDNQLDGNISVPPRSMLILKRLQE